MDFKIFEGKTIYLKTNSNRIYSGNVIQVEFVGYTPQGVEIYVLMIRDKFDKLVAISSKEIRFVEEERHNV